MDIEMLNDENEGPCSLRNPELWRLFCVATKRDHTQPNYVWKVRDVVEYLETMIKVTDDNDA